MAKFIDIHNQEGVHYYINIDHIICVYNHNIGKTLIRLIDIGDIITELPLSEVIKRIQHQTSS